VHSRNYEYPSIITQNLFAVLFGTVSRGTIKLYIGMLFFVEMVPTYEGPPENIRGFPEKKRFA
jgi:hypothetical protein